ncbi:MAG: VOC family protein, partial [Terriglobales bacterium]
RSAWTVYFQSADTEATATAVEQAGGRVRVAPMDIFDKGRMAAFTDPTGAEFAVWEPWENRGLGVVTEPNTLCWTELHTDNSDSAKVFYQAIFGWDVVENSSAEFSYTVLRPAGGDDMTNLGGIMGLTDDMIASGVTPHWRPYFEVTDCDAAVAKAEQSGGAVAWPAADLEGVGRMAALTDPFGASFSVITSACA